MDDEELQVSTVKKRRHREFERGTEKASRDSKRETTYGVPRGKYCRSREDDRRRTRRRTKEGTLD